MISRWFRYIRGGEVSLPASRAQKRIEWIKYLISTFCKSGLEGRFATQTRLDALSRIESEANRQAGASPSVMGLVLPNSLSPGQAADLANRQLSDFHRASWTRLGMSVVKGQVSVCEPYFLGREGTWPAQASRSIRPVGPAILCSSTPNISSDFTGSS